MSTDSVELMRLRLQCIVDAHTERVDHLTRELHASEKELAEARWMLWLLSSPSELPRVFDQMAKMMRSPRPIEAARARQPIAKRTIREAAYRREDIERLIVMHGPLTQMEIARHLNRNPRDLACLNLWVGRKLLGKTGDTFHLLSPQELLREG